MDGRVTGRVVVAGALLSLLAGVLLGDGPAKGRDARVDTGEVVIFRDGASRIIVAMDSFAGGADGLVDQWFVLQVSEESGLTLPIHFPVANTQYRQGALRVHSSEGPTVYDFSVGGYDAAWSEPQGRMVVHTVGYGLSRNSGKTTMQIKSGKRKSSARAITTEDDEDCPICMPLNDDPGTGGSSATTCDAGGHGSSSCSYGWNGHSCETTCDTRYYYACCTKTASGVTCKCVWASS